MTNKFPNENLGHRISLKKALLWIFFSTLLISGSSFLAFFYYLHVKESRSSDDKYRIIAIVQTCPEKECLKTIYLAELLDLSADRPTNLYQFKTKESEEKLLACPLIKQATINKISPGTIHVDYSLRIPLAFLGDYTNTAIDKEGYAFPFKPFFTPKKLPKIVIGEFESEGEALWGKQIKGKHAELAFTLFNEINKRCCNQHCSLVFLDVSKAYLPSYGQRQIVVMLEDREERIANQRSQLYIRPRILRLSTENIPEQIANYLVLRSYLRQQERGDILDDSREVVTAKEVVVDLRIPELAFIAKI